MFVARPPAQSLPGCDLRLIRAVRQDFSGSAEFLGDRGNRARVSEYLADLARPYGREIPAELFGEPPSPALGHSFAEMAGPLVGQAVRADEPVGLLVLAFSSHDLRPGQQTAAYLSHLTPGAPLAFAICDQGPAAAFTGLRIARDYVASEAVSRALVILVEQAALPYDCTAPLPARSAGVALLCGDRLSADSARPRLAGVRQFRCVPPDSVAHLADAARTELAADRDETTLVLSQSLAGLWTAPPARRVRVMPPGQPVTGLWCGLIDELTAEGTGLLLIADYDPGLRYLCLACVEVCPR